MTQASAAVLDRNDPSESKTGDEFMTRAVGVTARVDATELETYRSQLLRYAQWLLGDRDAAQDAVQDTLLAALHGPASFAGRSSVRTWLFGILRHKVMDAFRQQSRHVQLDEEFDDEALEAATFTADGEWRNAPADWGDPEGLLNRKRFFEVLQRAIDRLPKNAARVFTMREILDMDTGAICSAIGITQENCYVLLHRARMTLRGWLERDWAGEVRRESACGAAALQ